MISNTTLESKTTCLRIVDDIFDETKIIELDRDRDSVLKDLLFMQKTIRKMQKNIRLCIHVTHEVITLHWWSENRDFTQSIIAVASIPNTVLDCVKEGRVWK